MTCFHFIAFCLVSSSVVSFSVNGCANSPFCEIGQCDVLSREKEVSGQFPNDVPEGLLQGFWYSTREILIELGMFVQQSSSPECIT